MKTKAAQEVGVAVNHMKLPQDSTESQIVDAIQSLNRWVFRGEGRYFISSGSCDRCLYVAVLHLD